MGMDETGYDIETTKHHIAMLHRLGSNTIHKFHASRALRRTEVPLSFIYYLFRQLKALTGTTRKHAHSQLRLIIEFKGGHDPSQAQTPIRILQTRGDFVAHAKDWFHTLVQDHSALFPPYHKPRPFIVEVSNKTLGHVLLSHRQFLQNWDAQQVYDCCCASIPAAKRTKWGHAFLTASDARELVPDEFPPIISCSMKDTMWPSQQRFQQHHFKQFKKWRRRWRLPQTLDESWRKFLQLHLETHCSADRSGTHSQVMSARSALKGWVTLPADHFPTVLHLSCPQHFHRLLTTVFNDGVVFQMMTSPPEVTKNQILLQMPSDLRLKYRKLIDRKKPLPYAYLLPKATKGYCGARPIVAYSTSWNSRLSRHLAVAVTQILSATFQRQNVLPTVQHILELLWKTITEIPISLELLIKQQDLAGFYNAVPHPRILEALHYTISQYMQQQGLEWTSDISVSIQNTDQLHSLFRGRWRRQAHRHVQFALQDLIPLTRWLLSTSYFSIGQQTFRQIQGASMGSQLAPALCSAVAIVHENSWFSIAKSLPTWYDIPFLARYVDNRIMALTPGQDSSDTWQTFQLPTWYLPPLLLDDVEGDALLGFRACPLQRSLTVVQPADPGMIRSFSSACSLTYLLSGFITRATTICRYVRPRRLIRPQLHDLMAIYLRQQYPPVPLQRSLTRLLRLYHVPP
jgi:hypothetical protein